MIICCCRASHYRPVCTIIYCNFVTIVANLLDLLCSALKDKHRPTILSRLPYKETLKNWKSRLSHREKENFNIMKTLPDHQRSMPDLFSCNPSNKGESAECLFTQKTFRSDPETSSSHKLLVLAQFCQRPATGFDWGSILDQ